MSFRNPDKTYQEPVDKYGDRVDLMIKNYLNEHGKYPQQILLERINNLSYNITAFPLQAKPGKKR